MGGRGLAVVLAVCSCSMLVARAGAIGTGPRAEVMWLGAARARLETPEALGVRIPRQRIDLAPGRPEVVHLRVASAAPLDRTARARIEDERTARLLEPVRIAAGQTEATAIVLGVAPGSTTLEIAGTSTPVTVHATPDVPLAAAPAAVVTPMSGAAAWGKFAVGVSWSRETTSTPPRLVVGAGSEDQRLEPVWVTPPEAGVFALAAFAVDADALPAGPALLTPVWTDRTGAERTGQSVHVRLFHPGDGRVIAGECEATYDLPPLPEERRERPPRIGKHADASGGAYFDNAGTTPRFRFPLEISPGDGGGWYQVVASAGGDPAAGTLPAVGVTIDEAQYPLTRSLIAMPGFHRTPIGLPIRLEPGADGAKRVVRLDFLNDFYAAGGRGGGGADRNLRLDRIEILRVADAGGRPAAGAASGAMTMMMMGEPAPATMMMASPAMTDSADQGAGDASTMMSAAADTQTGMMGPSVEAGDDDAAAGEDGDRASAADEEADDAWPEAFVRRAMGGQDGVIALSRPLDGAEVAGDLEVSAYMWWPGMGQRPIRAPRVRLLIDGRTAEEQLSVIPRFVIGTGMVPPGEHEIAMVAEGDGWSAMTAPARVRFTPAESASAARSTQPALARFTVHDPRWTVPQGVAVAPEQSPPERAAFCLYSQATLTLNLPEDLAGMYEVFLEARGQAYEGAPELAVSLVLPGDTEPTPVGVLAAPSSWGEHAVVSDPSDRSRPRARVWLEPGHKRLAVEFTNDAYKAGPGGGDRNVFVQGLVLRAAGSKGIEKDLAGALVYPAAGQTVRADGADALVVSVTGSAPAREIEVVIDGEGTGQVVYVQGRPGPHTVPVSLRGRGPGPLSLAARITDTSGARFTTAPREVHAAGSEAGEATVYERAVALLDRFGFGPDAAQLARVLTLGPRPYLEEALAAGLDDPSVKRAVDLAQARYANSASTADVQRRAILEALATENPVRARFVLFTENHFSTWIRKTEPRRKAAEHARFTTLGVAPFPRLLMASATSPAMLRYLDQEQSFSRRLNENYAREIMELHTLGVHAGYTQEDVSSLARLLTGWTTTRLPFIDGPDGIGAAGVGPDEYGLRQTFVFDPALADNQERTLLGRRFEPLPASRRHWRALGAISLLAGHPACARFISTKIVEHYLHPPAAADLVEALSSTFERTGGDMREVLLTLAEHPRFLSTPPGERLAHPPDFAFRLARACGSTDAQSVHDYLNLSGRGMFDRSTPDGYQESDAEAMDSNAMLQRWKLARRLESAMIEVISPARRYGERPIDRDEAGRVIDLLSMRITGRLLNERSYEAAMQLLQQTAGRRDERWRALASFIASAPEAQLK